MGKSAFRELQDAVQEAFNTGWEEALEEVRNWLSERKAQPEFATVLIAFKADFVAPDEEATNG